MIDKDLLGEAARFNDAQAEEMGLPAFCAQHGIELEGLLYLADQRGLRGVMTLVMGVDPKELNMPLSAPKMLVHIPDNLKALLPLVQAAVVDGIAIGVKAKMLEAEDPRVTRLLAAASAALERTQVDDPDEATMILERVVTLSGEYVPPPA